jgi:multicomponent Na+:H+ antiporter subunit C
MNMLQLYALVGVAVFLLALHGLMMSTDAIRRLIAVNLMGAGTFIVMVALAGRVSPPDPVLHALVVTGLVVAISATAFALRLITASRGTDTERQQPAEQAGGITQDGPP